MELSNSPSRPSHENAHRNEALPRDRNGYLCRKSISGRIRCTIPSGSSYHICVSILSPSRPHTNIIFAYRGSFLPAVASLPNYLAEKGYQSPGDAYDGPWQYQFQTKDHYFDWTFKRPKESEAFNTLMTISRLGRGDNWFEFYPVEERLRVQTDDAILLVDVGGSIGHDVIAFKERFPNLKGRLIIEDLPNVVSEVKDLPAGIETVGHDFFKPQPDTVKGAKAYYLRTVLHDWPNKQSKVILKHIRDVMPRDSVLLINENSIPDTNAPLFSAQGDLSMMAMFASLDRTEKQFAELLDEAGFELVQVWRPKVMYPMSAVLFEAMLKD